MLKIIMKYIYIYYTYIYIYTHIGVNVYVYTHTATINMQSNWTFIATGVCVISVNYKILSKRHMSKLIKRNKEIP